MNQASSISIVNQSILRDHEPFKNETPDVFKFLTQTKTYTDASTMNESMISADVVSNVESVSSKMSTFEQVKQTFVPEVKKKEFLNPYLFVSFTPILWL